MSDHEVSVAGMGMKWLNGPKDQRGIRRTAALFTANIMQMSPGIRQWRYAQAAVGSCTVMGPEMDLNFVHALCMFL